MSRPPGKAAERAHGVDDERRGGRAARRSLLPRLLLGLVLCALLLALLGAQRALWQSGRGRAAAGDAWEALRAGTLAEPVRTDIADIRAVDGLVDEARAADAPLGRAVGALWASVALTLLVAGLCVWLLRDSSRRREHRERVDDGRTRREQAAILKLLDEIAPLASGDLRVRATVSEAMTGALADAFNHAVAELRWLVGTVDASAASVNGSVHASREAAQRLANACTVQAREIHRASGHLDAMSEAMAQLSVHAAESSRIASVSVSEAESGTRAIADSVRRLSRIRDEAELATRLMQRLADNATAIDERVETIRDVARRTDLLALNTTIRAAASAANAAADATLDATLDATGAYTLRTASAASASGDLSRLSDEVTRLADLLGGTARDIASLSRTIRQDAEDTVRAMDETNRELASGLEQAEQATGSLESIESVSRELQGLVRDMADRALHQSGVVRQLSSNMGVINRITSDTSLGVQATTGALDELQALALELRNGVADFRLPPTPPAADATTEAAVARAVTRSAMQASGRAIGHG